MRVLSAIDSVIMRRLQQNTKNSFESAAEFAMEVTKVSLNSSEILEQWLFGEKAAFSFEESDRVKDCVRIREGFVVLVSFVTNPHLFLTSTTWTSQIHNEYECPLMLTTLHSQKPCPKVPSTKKINKEAFLNRSYRATVALTTKSNSEFLEIIFPEYLEIICIPSSHFQITQFSPFPILSFSRGNLQRLEETQCEMRRETLDPHRLILSHALPFKVFQIPLCL